MLTHTSAADDELFTASARRIQKVWRQHLLRLNARSQTGLDDIENVPVGLNSHRRWTYCSVALQYLHTSSYWSDGKTP